MLPHLQHVNQLILRCGAKLVDKELVALTINLCWNPEIVNHMLTADVLHHFIKRVHQTFDPLLIKLVRQIAGYEQSHVMFKKYLHELVGMTLKSPTDDFRVDAIGLLNSITLPDVMYSELMVQHGLMDWLLRHLVTVTGFSADDDIILECIMLVGTLAMDPKAANMLGNPRLIDSLYKLLNEKIEDLDMVIHIVFTIFKLLLHPQSRTAIIMHHHLPLCLLDLVVDPSAEVRHLSNLCLDIIMEIDDSWRQRIKEKRFEAFNREWLEFIHQNGASLHAMHTGMNAGIDAGMAYGDSMEGDSMEEANKEYYQPEVSTCIITSTG